MSRENGNLIDYTEFKSKHLDIKTNYLEFYGLLGAIRKYAKRLDLEQSDPDHGNDTLNNQNLSCALY